MHALDTKYKAIVHYNHFLRSLRKVAKHYNVSKSTLARWVHGKVLGCSPKPSTFAMKQMIDTAIRECVLANPSAQLGDIQAYVKSNIKLTKSISTIQRYVKRAGVTRKRITQIADARTIESDAYDAQRTLFSRGIKNNIISIDETCFYSTDHVKYGYALKGKRARLRTDKRNMQRSKVSLLLAVSASKIVSFKTYTGSCGSIQFADFISSLKISPGTTLLMDNVAFHKTKLVREVARKKRVQLFFTPPYSPWYNPVEYVFSTLKHRFRKAIADKRHTSLRLPEMVRLIEATLRGCPTQGCFTHVQSLLQLNPVQAQLM
jgi:isfu1 transposase